MPTSRVLVQSAPPILFTKGSGESMSSLRSPGIQSDYREKGAELKMFGQIEEKEMWN